LKAKEKKEWRNRRLEKYTAEVDAKSSKSFVVGGVYKLFLDHAGSLLIFLNLDF
jgi:hypothetical protein